MTFEEFELLTKKLLERKVKKDLDKKISIDHQKAFTSLKGSTYKIDLSYDFQIAGAKYLTLVECKYWNSYVTREKVGYFKAILDDLAAQKGIVVTTRGFQPSAKIFAESNNIALYKLTNNNRFEVVFNADGNLKAIGEFLTEETDDFDAAKEVFGIGWFHPAKDSIYDYIAKHYGEELSSFLKTGDGLSPIVKKQLKSMPPYWHKNYQTIETAAIQDGCNKLSNEKELRSLVSLIFIANFGDS